MAIVWLDAVSPMLCPVNSKVCVPVSVHGCLSGSVVVGLVSPNIFCLTSPSFSRHLGFYVHCCTDWIAVVCRRFVTVVLSDFSMAIVLSWISCVFIEERFASAKLVSTGVVQSWPDKVTRPA